MTSYKPFKEIYKGISLEVEDLFLLESFQIGYLPGLLREPDLAAVLRAYPSIKRFIVNKCPSITDYVERILSEHPTASSEKQLVACVTGVLWTVADMIVFNKCPEVYDSLEFHSWDFREITIMAPFHGKVVIDAGAGTGRVALQAARTARRVYAVEPVARLRQFIRDKAHQAYLDNIFVIDGFLHAVPLPDKCADILVTSHALGWQLENELREFERVVKRGGFIIHCPGTADIPEEENQHLRLISNRWGYQFSRYQESDGWKRKYWKQL